MSNKRLITPQDLTADMFHRMNNVFTELETQFKPQEVGNSKIPAGTLWTPAGGAAAYNTVSGMVQKVNMYLHHDTYGRRYIMFGLKIGGNVDRQVNQAVIKRLEEEFPFHMAKIEGTNWSMYGYSWAYGNDGKHYVFSDELYKSLEV